MKTMNRVFFLIGVFIILLSIASTQAGLISSSSSLSGNNATAIRIEISENGHISIFKRIQRKPNSQTNEAKPYYGPYNPVSYPGQYSAASYHARYPAASYPAQYPAASYPAQYPAASYPAQYPAASYHAQYPAAPYAALYPAASGSNSQATGSPPPIPSTIVGPCFENTRRDSTGACRPNLASNDSVDDDDE